MAKIRPISLFLILLSSGFSLLTGFLLDRTSPGGTANYRAVYYGARCVIDRADPYSPDNFLRVYTSESGEFPTSPSKRQLFLRAVMVCVNLPTTLFLVAPLALISWGPSHLIWLLLSGCGFTLAGVLAYDLAREFAPGLALVLVVVMLVNSEVLFATGNTAGISVGLCVIAVWCLVRARVAWLGVACLALSLALKPHDCGLVWLFLLLAGGTLRKRSLQALALTAALIIPALLWVSNVAPHWAAELKNNLVATSAPGDISDPGPTSISRKGSADVIIDLQSLVSVFKDNPDFYNPFVYAICGVLLAMILAKTLRIQTTAESIWLALAALSALSMLATYHRPYDAKLLLLAVPGSALLWSRGHRIGKFAVLITTCAIVSTSDIPLAILSLATRQLDIVAMPFAEKVATIVLTRPAPLFLLAMVIVFLMAYMKLSPAGSNSKIGKEPHCATAN